MMASPYVPSNRAAPPAESFSGESIPPSSGTLPSCASSPAAATADPPSTAPLVPSTAPLPPLSVVRSTVTAAHSDVSSAVHLAAADAGRAAPSAAPTGTAHSVPSVAPSTRHDCYCSLLDFLLLVGQLKKLKRTGWLRNGIQPHNAETVAEHSFRAAVCALLIGSDSQSAELIARGKLDKNKCVKMALVHDLAEALIGDITPFCPVSPDEKRRREKEAMKQICALLPAAPVSSAALRGCPACTACWDSSIKSDSRCMPGCNETITSSSIGSSSRSSTSDVSSAAAEILSLFEEYEAGESAEAKFVLDIDKFEMILQAFEYEAEAYSYSTPLENGNKRSRAREPEPLNIAETKAAQRVKGLPALHISEPHQQDLEEEADIHKQQKTSIFPQQQHKSEQQNWQQQQQQAQQGSQSDGQSTTQALQRQQQGLTAYPLTSLQQSPQVESHELTDKQQQQRQQQDQHQHSHHQSRETHLPCTQRRKWEGKETAQHGLRLSSFFQTTKGVFKSGLFQMLDTLLRERRKELHDT